MENSVLNTRVVKHWKQLPGEAIECPSFGIQNLTGQVLEEPDLVSPALSWRRGEQCDFERFLLIILWFFVSRQL